MTSYPFRIVDLEPRAGTWLSPEIRLEDGSSGYLDFERMKDNGAIPFVWTDNRGNWGPLVLHLLGAVMSPWEDPS